MLFLKKGSVVKIQKKLIIGLILFSNMLSAGAFRGSLPQVSRALGQRLQSSVNPIKSSFTSFKPGQSTTFARPFVSKTLGESINFMLNDFKTFNRFFPQRGMGSQYMHSNVQEPLRSSWQGSAKLFGLLAGGLGLSAASIGRVKAEEYRGAEAGQLLGINNINDLADPDEVLAFLDKDDYKKEVSLFSVIVSDNFEVISKGIRGALKVLQAHRTKDNLEKIRFLNKAVFDVANLSKVSLAEKTVESIKKALASLLTVQFTRADGTVFTGDVAKIDQIKKESALSQIMANLREDIELRAHLLHKFSQNKNFIFYGYSGELLEVEKQFAKASELFGGQLPDIYKEFAEMIFQNEEAYDKVKYYKNYFPKLFAAIEGIEKGYSSESTPLRINMRSGFSKWLSGQLKKEEQPKNSLIQEKPLEKTKLQSLLGRFS